MAGVGDAAGKSGGGVGILRLAGRFVGFGTVGAKGIPCFLLLMEGKRAWVPLKRRHGAWVYQALDNGVGG